MRVSRKKDSKCYYHLGGKALANILNRPNFWGGFFMPNTDFLIYENLIGVVILVMFGGRKIPEFMRGLGKGIREFNDAKNNVKKEIEEGIKEKDEKAS